jgi:TatD DNase family protein
MTGNRAAEMLDRARGAGVAGMVVPGTKVEDGRQAVALASQHDDVWAAVGFHPHESSACDAGAFREIEQLSTQPRVVAVGEIGLDYHYTFSPPDVQRHVFMSHLALANRHRLPVIIHNRESTEDLLDLLDSKEGRHCRGILHSFTESYEVARKLVDRGFFISFSGIVTFKNAETLREVAQRLPHQSVLIETDTPYLAPVPHRGKENEPAYVVRIAELLAALWSLPLNEVGRITTGNFERAFGVTIRR